DGIFVTDKDSYKKYTISGILRTDLTEKLSSELNLNYYNDNISVPGNIGNILSDIALRKSAVNFGTHQLEDGTILPTLTAKNILEREPPRQVYKDNLRIFERLVYNISNDLKLTGEYTFIKSNNNRIDIATDNKYWDISSFFVIPMNDPSSYFRNFAENNHHALNIYANFDKKLGKHSLNALAGTNQELIKSSGFSARRLDLLSISVPSLATSTGIMS